MKKHKLLYSRNKSGENLSDAIDIIRKINNGSIIYPVPNFPVLNFIP